MHRFSIFVRTIIKLTLGQTTTSTEVMVAMKLSLLILMMISRSYGFIVKSRLSSISTLLHLSSTSSITTSVVPTETVSLSKENTLLPRIVLKTLPKVYVYDHCPFCVRVRLALGLKNIKHDVIYFANDDVDTPTKLVGKKIAPIFEYSDVIPPMPESLDIIKKIDSDPTFGPINFFKPASNRVDIAEWQKKVAAINRIIQRPRYMLTILPEFASRDGKNAFVKNHPLEPYDKSTWKNDLNDDQRWDLYNKAYIQSFDLINEANEALKELDSMIYSIDYCTEGGLSYDDIDLWSRLRSVTLVKGIIIPLKLDSYLKNLSTLADLPLYYSIAN